MDFQFFSGHPILATLLEEISMILTAVILTIERDIKIIKAHIL